MKLDPEFARSLEVVRNSSEAELEAMELDFQDLQLDGENICVTKENV